jgi:hypothetical protein
LYAWKTVNVDAPEDAATFRTDGSLAPSLNPEDSIHLQKSSTVTEHLPHHLEQIPNELDMANIRE